MADPIGPYIGNPNIQRQAAKARLLAEQRIPENLPDPRTYGFMRGLLGTPPEDLGMSAMSPNTAKAKEAAYIGGQISNAAQIAPALSGIAKGVNAAKGLLADVGGSSLPSTFVHGTTPEGAAAIRSAGKFDPSAGNRMYTYSQLGPDTAYFAPEGSWWLDKQKAANARAISYDDAVKMQLDPSAKVRVINNEKDLNKAAKDAGFVDAYDMMTTLNVDSLDYAKQADKARNSSFKEFSSYMKQEFPDFPSRSLKDHYEGMKELSGYFDNARNATKQLIDSGIDGLYISPKYGENVTTPLEFWHPSSDQLALFRPELAKVLPSEAKGGLLSNGQ